jgi:hypothetical protein
MIQQQISKGVLHQNIDISKFSAGMYRLRIETLDAGLIESFSIIKQ